MKEIIATNFDIVQYILGATALLCFMGFLLYKVANWDEPRGYKKDKDDENNYE